MWHRMTRFVPHEADLLFTDVLGQFLNICRSPRTMVTNRICHEDQQQEFLPNSIQGWSTTGTTARSNPPPCPVDSPTCSLGKNWDLVSTTTNSQLHQLPRADLVVRENLTRYEDVTSLDTRVKAPNRRAKVRNTAKVACSRPPSKNCPDTGDAPKTPHRCFDQKPPGWVLSVVI